MRADRDWAHAMYSMFARGGDDEKMLFLVLPGLPWSKARPRFAKRGGVYQPRDDRDAEQALKARLVKGGGRMFPGNVMLACRFYRPNNQRIDADNLLKHVCDSANGVLFHDDCQVTFVMGEVHFDVEFPRTVLLVANHASTLLRGADLDIECEHCHKMYRPQHDRLRAAVRRYCGRDCRAAARLVHLDQPVPCEQCGSPFRRGTTAQRFCSVGCRATAKRGVAKPVSNRSKCESCGKQLAHNRGGRCRDCWRANPRHFPPITAPVPVELGAQERLI